MTEPHRRRPSTIAAIDTEIERLRERRRQIILKDNERFARAAIKAGLAELAIADDDLDRAFAAIATQFRGEDANAPSPPPLTP